MKEGFTTVVEKDDAIVFKTNNGEEHNITIDEINPIYVRLTINSEPVVLILNEGDERRLNLSSAMFYNLYLKVNVISADRVSLKIQTISESIYQEDEEEEASSDPIHRDLKAYLYFIMALIIFIVMITFNRKLNKLEKEHKDSEQKLMKENEKRYEPKNKNKKNEKTKTKTKRKR